MTRTESARWLPAARRLPCLLCPPRTAVTPAGCGPGDPLLRPTPKSPALWGPDGMVQTAVCHRQAAGGGRAVLSAGGQRLAPPRARASPRRPEEREGQNHRLASESPPGCRELSSCRLWNGPALPPALGHLCSLNGTPFLRAPGPTHTAALVPRRRARLGTALRHSHILGLHRRRADQPSAGARLSVCPPRQLPRS